MRTLRRFRAWCRAVDAAIDAANARGEHHPPPPTITTAMAILLMAVGVAVSFVASERSTTFAVGLLGACVCFATAIALAGPAQYQVWLSRQWRLNGKCPHCGFDLRHSPDHCPECGSPVSEADRKHMTVTFNAKEAGAVSEQGFTKVWLASTSPRHILTLQRANTSNRMSEIFVVFDFEPHSTPGQIVSYSITSDHLDLELTGYFNNRYDHFQITLELAQPQRETLNDGLQKLFQDTTATRFRNTA